MKVTRKCKQCQSWFQAENRVGRGIFCSQRCNALYKNRMCPLTQADRRKGALKGNETKRRRALEKLAGMSPVEIFRKGYRTGWHRGVRYARGIQRVEDQPIGG